MTTVASVTRPDPIASLEHLCLEVGGAFEFNADGECELMFDDRIPTLIRREHDDSITIGVCVAHNVTADETWLLARLMSYQWLGQMTNGFLLSWNDQAGTIVLSHRVGCTCSMADLRGPLERLLETANSVQHDIHELIEAGEDRVPEGISASLAASSLNLKV